MGGRGASLTRVEASSPGLMARHGIRTVRATGHHPGLTGAQVVAFLKVRCGAPHRMAVSGGYPSPSSSYATPSTPLRLSSANGDTWSSNPGSASVPVISSLDRPACISRRVRSSAAVK